MVHDVFISYSAQDKAVADEICATLESNKFNCWISPRDIPPGQPYAASLVNAIRASRVFVLVLSKSSNLSPHVIREVSEAVTDGITIIPFRIEDVNPYGDMRHYIMSTTFWLDAITPPLERHLERLTSTIEDVLGAGEEPLGDQQPIDVDYLITEDREPEDTRDSPRRAREQRTILDAFAQTLLHEAHVLKDRPDLLWQQLYNRLQWEDEVVRQFLAPELEQRRIPGSAPWILKKNRYYESEALIRTLSDYTVTAVTAVAVTPDGKKVISGSVDGPLKVWDMKSGEALFTLQGHTERINDVVVTPDGRQAISGSDDKTTRVWNLRTGELIWRLEGHSDKVRAVVVTQDGSHAISGSLDKTIKVWNLDTGIHVNTLMGHIEGVQALAVTPDGKRVVSGSSKGFKVWDLQSGELLHIIEDDRDITAVAVTPDGRFIITGGFLEHTIWDLRSGEEVHQLDMDPWIMALSVTPDGQTSISVSQTKIKVSDLKSGEKFYTLEGHMEEIDDVAVTSDGKQALTCAGNEIKFWDLQSRIEQTTIKDLQVVGKINAVIVSPDGRQAISVSSEKNLWVWDLENGEALHPLRHEWKAIDRVIITPNGMQIISGSGKDIKLCDLNSGEVLRTLEGHSKLVRTVAVTSDGRHVISGSGDKTLKVWDFTSGELLRTLKGHTDWINEVVITPGGSHAVSGSTDQTLRVWDLQSGELLHTLEGHTKDVYAVAVTLDGRRAVSGSEDKTLRVWDLQSGELLHTLEGHTDEVRALAVTLNGSLVVSGSDDNNLRVWDLQSGELLHTLEGHTDNVRALAATPDGRHVISGSLDKTLKVWDFVSGELIHTLEGHMDFVMKVAVTSDGKHALSGSRDKTLRVWDLEKGKELHSLKGGSAIHSVAVTPDARRVISGSASEIKVWELYSGEALLTFGRAGGRVKAVAMTPDGQRLISSSSDEISVWDIESEKILHTLEGHTEEVSALAVTHSGRIAISGSKDQTLRVWNLQSGELLHVLEGHMDQINEVVVTPNGRYAVSGSKDQTIRVWDLEIGKEFRVLEGHKFSIEKIVVTPEGSRILSFSHRDYLKLWDLESGKTLHTLETSSLSFHDPSYECKPTTVAVSPDGKHAVSGRYSSIKVWDLDSGVTLHTIEGHKMGVEAVAITPDGQRLISSSVDNTLRVWDLQSGNELARIAGIGSGNQIAIAPDGLTYIIGTGLGFGRGQVQFLSLENITPGAPIITAHRERSSILVVQCLLCMETSTIKESELGTEILCTGCGTALRVNPFIIGNTLSSGVLKILDECKDQASRTNRENAIAQTDALRNKGKELIDSGVFEGALDCYNRGLELLPNDLTLLVLRVSALLKLGRNQEALGTIDYVLEKDLAAGHNLGNVYEAKGNALAGMGDHEDALNYYRKSLDIVPDESKTWYIQGYVLHELGNYEAALDSFKQAQEIEDNEDTNLLISYCYMGMEDYSEAEQVYRNMLEHGSSNPIVYHGLGLALCQQQENDEACQWLQRFIDNAQAEHAYLVPQVQQIIDKLS